MSFTIEASKATSSLISTMVKRWEASAAGTNASHTPIPSSGPAPDLRERIPYDPTEFEQDVQRLLDLAFPFCCLPGIQVFSPCKRGETEFGSEMDHLLHFRMGGTDYLVVVEAKMQSVQVDGDRWRVNYSSGPKDASKQVSRQLRTLWEYLRPIGPKTDLKMIALVVSVDAKVSQAVKSGHLNSPLVLVPITGLVGYLRSHFNLDGDLSRPAATPLRVSQSPFLSLLRRSCPIPALGHPELKTAISYVERCRRSLDESIYKDFIPTRSHWAINGSAGMGKSVLLAYSAAVFCSGYCLGEFEGEAFPVKANDVFGRTGFKNDHKLSVGILAMSSKQLENLRYWFQFFTECFQSLDETGQIRFRKPDFILVRTLDELKERRWSALLVDECHDIPPAAERMLVESHREQGFILIVACDRHQKLRYAADDARILSGMDFGRKTRRLNQNYRNPTPVNIASLALMFRWFAEGGHKVVPTKEQLESQFGFTVTGERATGFSLSIQTDAHPANSWAHTVASFPDAASVYRHLLESHLAETDVLWTRFSEEDLDFNYEELGRRFIYHNCRSIDAHKISDKYIKGQDYPVVVIEGFPGFMDRAATPEEEEKMWSFRRELYLCASRATCFLYFVVSERETDEVKRIQHEIRNLVTSLSVPANFGKGGTKKWECFISPPETSRGLDVFRDNDQELASIEGLHIADLTSEDQKAGDAKNLVPAAATDAPTIKTGGAESPPNEEWDLFVHGPITVTEFATEVGVKPYQVLAELIKMKIFASGNSLIEVPALRKLTTTYGGTLRLYEEEPEEVGVEEEGFEERDRALSIGSNSNTITLSPVDESKSVKAEPRSLEAVSSTVNTNDSSAPPKAEKARALDLISNAPSKKPLPTSPVAKDPHFVIGSHTVVRVGSWIEDSNYGIGRILKLNTRPGYADSHRVWFAKSNTILASQPLRGRVTKVLAETRVPPDILAACPPPPWDS